MPTLGGVFRVYDVRSGRAEAVAGRRGGRLGICLASPVSAGHIRPADLRACLVADLIYRVAERHQLLVSACQQAPAGIIEAGGLRAACDELNIYPAEPSPGGLGPHDIAVAPAGGYPSGAALRFVESADAWFASGEDRESVTPGDVIRYGLDPLALRLAFLTCHYRVPMALTLAGLEQADQTLGEWRTQVADWSCAPSRPMATGYLREVLAAFDDDLDTPAALGRLTELAADAGIAPGSKFETFAYLDRLLGLDLAREVGR
jgi:hypothetical protein